MSWNPCKSKRFVVSQNQTHYLSLPLVCLHLAIGWQFSVQQIRLLCIKRNGNYTFDIMKWLQQRRLIIAFKKRIPTQWKRFFSPFAVAIKCWIELLCALKWEHTKKIHWKVLYQNATAQRLTVFFSMRMSMRMGEWVRWRGKEKSW